MAPNVPFWFLFYPFYTDLQSQQVSVFSVNPIQRLLTITAHADSKGHRQWEIADIWPLSDDCSSNRT